jgi:hypothetical protein
VVRDHLTRVAVVLLLSGAAGPATTPGRHPPDEKASPAPSSRLTRLIRSGDLVFRVGIGWRAGAVRLLGRDALSHVGIAVIERGAVHVVHAAPPDADGPGGVVDQTLTVFAGPSASRGIAIYRRGDLNRSGERRIADSALRYAALHVPFDDRFDLSDARAFYCTELVLRASAAADAPIAVRPTTLGGLLAGSYVLPRDLLATGRFRLVARWPQT